MNISLPIFYSKEKISSRFFDFSNILILPAVCLFGLFTSSTCMLGSYKHDESNSRILNYIFLNSLVDFFFLLTQFWSFIIRCGAVCPYGYTYISKVFEIYIYSFLGYTLVNSQAIFSILVSFDRFKMFSSLNPNQTNLYRSYFLCFLISIGLNFLSIPLIYTIHEFAVYIPSPNKTEVLYRPAIRNEFESRVIHDLLAAFLTVKDPFMYLIFGFINVVVVIKFQKYVNRKKSLTEFNNQRCK